MNHFNARTAILAVFAFVTLAVLGTATIYAGCKFYQSVTDVTAKIEKANATHAHAFDGLVPTQPAATR